ncbi:MAG: DJ-1/PfpI family protein [Sedimentisphaerales bacterium]|nr:DJ-1/PfpI family protein [Sedimentisphaerales bacterium]
METSVLLFDDVNALDVVGPCEVLSKIPNMSIKYVAKQIGAKKTNIQAKLTADYTFSEISNPDILLIPGGQGIKSIVNDEIITKWIRQTHEDTIWTASVCSGALVLAIAGVLRGLKATTHWVKLPCLEDFGAKPQKQRVVIDGKVITCAGVSAGIDMALTLTSLIAGETAAQAIQLAIEYDPAPPFDCGSPDKAPRNIFELVIQKVENQKNN